MFDKAPFRRWLKSAIPLPLLVFLICGGPTQAQTPETESDLIWEELAGLQDKIAMLPDIGGYYDFEYFKEWGAVETNYFRQHHFTLLVTKEMDDWRIFGEIEFENGTLISGNGTPDPKIVTGDLKLEQAWVEREFADALKIRFGLSLAPYETVVSQWPNLRATTRRPAIFDTYPEKYGRIGKTNA